jgi:hypothetical protein
MPSLEWRVHSHMIGLAGRIPAQGMAGRAK